MALCLMFSMVLNKAPITVWRPLVLSIFKRPFASTAAVSPGGETAAVEVNNAGGSEIQSFSVAEFILLRHKIYL